MIKVHHLNRSRSHRVLWLLEELGLDYEMATYVRNQKTFLAPPSLKDIHPLGKSPTVEDQGDVLIESGAVLELLLNRYDKGKLRPVEGTAARDRYLFWLHYAEGSVMPMLLINLVLSRFSQPPVPALLRPILGAAAKQAIAAYSGPELEKHLDYVEAELKKSAYLAGDEFSAADIQMNYPLEAAVSRGATSHRPVLTAYLKRLRERPAYQQALKKGGELL